MGNAGMTQLRELGVGLLVLAAVFAFTYENFKKSDQMRFKGLPQVFDRESYPALFEARTKTVAWTAIIAFVIGLALLMTQA